MLLIKRLIFLLLILCAALAAHYFSATPQSYWFILSLFLFSLIEMGDTFFRRLSIIALTGLVAVITVLITAAISGFVIPLAVTLAVITICCVMLIHLFPQYYLPFLILNLFAIMSGTLAADLQTSVDRTLYVLGGVAVVVLLQIIYLPGFTRNELRTWMSKTLLNLDLCNKEIFSCFLQPEYINNLYLFERRVHVQKNKLIQSLNRSRQIVMDTTLKMTQADRDSLAQWLITIEYIYTIILDCAQLRRRVTDHTVFGLCGNEMESISKEISEIIREVMKLLVGRSSKIDAIALSIKIKHLDENYQNVLRITSREPLVFVLYISSLKILNNELLVLYKNTSLVAESLENV